jgi:acyl-CoA thioesterase-1
MQSDIQPFLKQFNLQRRHCIALLATTGCGGAFASSARASTVLILGDSLSAEYGLRRASGWVALLETKLKLEKPNVEVVNASISGDTTSGGRSRLGSLLSLHKPGVVVIELGGNDALRGLPLAMTQENLSAMTQAAQQAGARVLLLGMQVPPNYGKDYSQRFAQMYADVARTQKAAWVRFFLKGVADVPDNSALFQADRIHPTELAQPLLLANVWPEIKRLLP